MNSPFLLCIQFCKRKKKAITVSGSLYPALASPAFGRLVSRDLQPSANRSHAGPWKCRHFFFCHRPKPWMPPSFSRIVCRNTDLLMRGNTDIQIHMLKWMASSRVMFFREGGFPSLLSPQSRWFVSWSKHDVFFLRGASRSSSLCSGDRQGGRGEAGLVVDHGLLTSEIGLVAVHGCHLACFSLPIHEKSRSSSILRSRLLCSCVRVRECVS